MILFPNCKINIGLHITAKRADGFHEIETIMYPVPNVKDALEIIESSNLELHVSGANFGENMYDNIVVKAHQLLQANYKIPNVTIHLHKAIPHGAGLGGGSADAACMLQLLNNYFKLNLDTQILQNYAAQLGSDCAFFIENKPALATGRGEILQPIDLNLSMYKICLLKPSFSINTAQAYGRCKPQKPNYNLSTTILQPIHTWKNIISNDFENLCGEYTTEIVELKNTLYQAGAMYAAMSGSGSTVYGIFNKECNLPAIKNVQIYWSGL